MSRRITLFLLVFQFVYSISSAQIIPVFPTKPKVKVEAKPKIKAVVNKPIQPKSSLPSIEMINVGNFSICKYEVTQAQWVAVMGSNPSYFKGENLPVEQVSWDDVQVFIKKLNALTGKSYRLPTEAEWEFAAKGASQSHGYDYAGSNDLNAVSWYIDNSGNCTHPVGQKQPNELGIYDMTGNVWEWCNDWNDEAHNYFMFRGGSFYENKSNCRMSFRLGYGPPSTRNNGLGFRFILPN